MFAAAWYAREYDVPGLPLRPGDIVLDIGANQGFFTCLAAQQGAHVYAFEPNPDSFERLLLNVRENGFSDRVVARPWAIASKEGPATLLISNELAGGMSTIVPEFARNASITIAASATVPVYTLPGVLDQFHISRVRLCKIDAEGSELGILRTLNPAMLSLIDIFVAEIHPEAYPPEELIDLIRIWGTHQIIFPEDRPFSANIVRAVSSRLRRGRDFSDID
jgi:FkbM family methyltransferase